ncbi:uncharacterized protein MYCFIDRAFT_176667 [Pseudocercospora fijiensis CIRAD86]|uniref:Uncharacterized protein n=1 Tax=Pseudocercospora fijiensis (strain CIRAD86) TaxID=383855 RepID=M2YUH6_PSEFD|nr:uncharacterized protein MYCFIDRAFT_176667 [Pseudocercospora fijiensis CIRAD86]EME81385.1 hypothetical protein MYCFIDRAFT_176667 [Pseudocercospora fijiensis CIRAD86]
MYSTLRFTSWQPLDCIYCQISHEHRLESVYASAYADAWCYRIVWLLSPCVGDAIGSSAWSGLASSHAAQSSGKEANMRRHLQLMREGFLQIRRSASCTTGDQVKTQTSQASLSSSQDLWQQRSHHQITDLADSTAPGICWSGPKTDVPSRLTMDAGAAQAIVVPSSVGTIVNQYGFYLVFRGQDIPSTAEKNLATSFAQYSAREARSSDFLQELGRAVEKASKTGGTSRRSATWSSVYSPFHSIRCCSEICCCRSPPLSACLLQLYDMALKAHHIHCLLFYSHGVDCHPLNAPSHTSNPPTDHAADSLTTRALTPFLPNT